MSTLTDVMIQIGLYLVVFLGSIAFFNFLSNGFLLKWIRAKASRGRFVLIELDGLAEMIWVLGKLNDNHLRWKSGGEDKSLIIGRDDLYRRYGVKAITIDAETNAVRKIDWTVADKIDSEAYDDKLQRAIEAPELTNKNEKILLALALVVIIIGVLYTGWQVTTIKEVVMGGTTQLVGVVG